MAEDPGDDVDRAMRQPVELTEYDDRWPRLFTVERDRVIDALPGVFIAIEHIGSTAVPGLRSKPLIDLLAGVPSMAAAIALNRTIGAAGYVASARYNESLTTRQWFMRQQGGRRTHHLHVVVHDGDEWHLRLRFRDRLRADPALRERYATLKDDLARRFADDRDAYTAGKSEFVENALRDDRSETRG